MKKAKLDSLDYKSWGVEKYGYELELNPDTFMASEELVLDVENYKDGSFAGVGALIPGAKKLWFWNSLPIALHSFKIWDGTLIGHVVRTDVAKLRRWGFKLNPRTIHYDTALIEHLINSTKKEYGLKSLVKEKFGIEYPTYTQVVGTGDFDKVPLEVIANYNGMDLVATYELWKSQNHELQKSSIYCNLLWPLGETISSMEERGLKINLDRLQNYGNLITNLHTQVTNRLKNELGDINFNSTAQKLKALSAKGIMPRYKGKPSTNKNGLKEQRKIPLIDDLLQYSELQKLLSSYVTPYISAKSDIVHSFFSQTGTRTGRLSSSNPNVQQIPKHGGYARDFQNIFEARPGYKYVELDYSAIEPRMLAHFSKSKALTELFKSGINFHDFTAKRLSVDRQVAKVLNLSTGYRATKYALAFQLKCSVEEAERHLNEWWALWPDLYLWEQNLISVTKQKGYIETLLGRKIYIDGLDSNERKTREKAERRVIENLAQGSTADLIGKAMIYLHNRGFKIVNQIHDAVLLELDDLKYISRARNIMENVLHLEVPTPVEVKIGDTWGEMIKHA